MPRWAGADGFTMAWKLNEFYHSRAGGLLHARDLRASGALDDEIRSLEARRDFFALRLDLLSRRARTLDSLRPMGERATEGGDDDRVRETGEDALREAHRIEELSEMHRAAMRNATPILFDPLGMPELDPQSVEGLRLPFETTTCDFLSSMGMAMPVPIIKGHEDWVGVVSVTFVQQGDAIDAFPVVTTLDPLREDSDQRIGAVCTGMVRFGTDAWPGHEHLVELESPTFSARVLSIDEDALWADLWVVAPALAAATALRLLDAVNVELQEVQLPRQARRRAEREGAQPALEVMIRSGSGSGSSTVPASEVDWQHRWTVRGHWKRFTRGPIYDANPRRRIDEGGVSCVKVWCPPFVKGPEDKPLVLKSRKVHPNVSQ